jgi:aryl-alcohol dehydrogenase-like predicted oxidoreductase
VGLSNVNEDEVRAAQKIVRVESVQNRCNISDPEDVKTGLVAFCGKQGMAYLPYSPVGGHFGHKSLAKHRVLQPIAKAHGRSPQQVMLAWLLAKGPHVLPIPGASKATSITDSAAAVNVKLSAAEIQQLEQK